MQKQPATGGAGAKPPAPAPSKADSQTVANLKNQVSQRKKNTKDYKAKANHNMQAATGGKPDSKAAQPKANANAVAPDSSKFTKLKKPLAEMTAVEAKKVLCRFFVNGTCSKGKDCKFGYYDPRDSKKKYIALFPEDARKGKAKPKAKPQAKPRAKSGAKTQQKKGNKQQQKKKKLPPNALWKKKRKILH